jgi:hypothetical protein
MEAEGVEPKYGKENITTLGTYSCDRRLWGVPFRELPRLLAIGNLGDILPSLSISTEANGMSVMAVRGVLAGCEFLLK